MTRPTNKAAVSGAVVLLHGRLPEGLKVYENRRGTRVVIESASQKRLEIGPSPTDTGKSLAEWIEGLFRRESPKGVPT